MTLGRKGPWLIGLAVLVAGGAVVGVTDPFTPGRPVAHGGVARDVHTMLYTVTQEDLSSQTEISATLGYANPYPVVNQDPGTLTSLPAVGQVALEGQVLYRVAGAPVVLLYGSTPAYRDLYDGLIGTDVEELNADLVALGYVSGSELSPTSNQFSYWTGAGVEKLQSTLGETQTGTLGLGQAVFESGAVRVTALSANLGMAVPAGQPVMSATSTTRQVTITLDTAQESEVAVGDAVTITLPDNATTAGVISSVGTVATVGSTTGTRSATPTISVVVTPTDPGATGTWDQAPVSVSITTGSVKNALVVPVDALLASVGGGYAVEAVTHDGGRHLVPVSLGLFDDAAGLVQVKGRGLSAGMRVVVPSL